MSEWDKLWDKNKEKVHTSWHPEAYLDEWLSKVKVEGGKLQEKQRETQFLLNCESDMHKDCRLQLGNYMKKLNDIKQTLQEYEYGIIINGTTLHHKLVEILEEEKEDED